MFLIGAMVGNFVVKWIIVKGRWLTMMIVAVGTIIASAIMTIDDNPYLILSGRFLVGLFAGVGPLLVSKYIEESCPMHVKAQLGTLTQIQLIFGVSAPLFL